MAKLIMCKGLPGSGKTTFANRLCKEDPNCVRVNKDDIRIELGMNRKSYKREQEYAVIDRRDQLIKDGLKQGKTVISDDTNFGKKHEPRLRQLAAEYGAEFEIKDFTDVPVEVCIERDAQRSGDARVGADVIWGMAEQHLGLTRPSQYFPVEGTPLTIMCDLDGTLALFKGLRGPYDYAKCANDRLNDVVYSIIKVFSFNGYQIVYMTGREDWARNQTEDFLALYNCPKGPLFMRSTGDHRKDAVVKKELFDQYVRNKYNVRFVLDDRDQVVRMWRDLGLTCLQVADGNF